MTEMHGAIPLPPGKVHVHYDPLTGIETAQQPQAQQVAVFEASPNDDCFNGAMIDVNQHFVVYAVKNGLIRVLHRHSSLRSLLRFHEGHIVTDIAFFQSGDVLGTVGGHVAIWRLFEKSNQIVAEVLLEIPDRLPSVSRLIWHPFNPNQFWLFHEDLTGTRVATLVETTRIATVAGNHAVCQMFSDDVVMEGAVRIAGADVTDLCWSGRDTRHVLTVHSDGTIRFWDIKSVDVKPSGTGTVSPLCKFVVEERVPQYRCLFLPHENASTENGTGQSATLTTCFCTSSKQNSCVTLWTPFTEDASPTKIQVFSMDQANLSYNLSVCHGPMTAAAEIPPAFFVVLSDRREGKLFCLSLKSLWSQHEPRRPLVHGFDYIVPFQTKYPTYSWSVMCGPAEHLEESAPTGGLNFDIRFYALQSKMVQQLTLSHYMCLPPAGEWVEGTSGVWSEPLVPNLGKFVVDFDEDYALDEIGSYAEEDDFAAPDASSLPQPIPEPTKDKDQSNPFANWLGALATKSTMVEPSKEIDPIAAAAPPTTPAAALVQGTAGGTMNALPDQPTGKGIPGFLSPMDLLSPPVKNVGSSSGHGKATETQRRTEGRKSSKSPKREKSPQRKHRKLHVDNKIAILKRDQNTAASSPPQIATQPDDKVPSSISEENLKNALVTHQKQQEKHILQVVKRTVREEIQTSVIPELCKAVGQMIDNATNQSLRQSVEQAMERGATLKESDIQKQIASNVEQTLKETFSESMERVLIPGFEAATQEMLSQVTAGIERGGDHPVTQTNELALKIESLTRTVDALANEIAQIRGANAGQGSALIRGLSAQTPVKQDPKQVILEDILETLRLRNFEAAFTKALSASTAEVVLFCCKNASLSDVFGGSTPALSQPILLCLMQQLGAVLVASEAADLQTLLAWLQEIALTLDTTSEAIQRHVPSVLQQLVSSINVKMAQGDPTLRRPLQMLLQVIRGMQH